MAADRGNELIRNNLISNTGYDKIYLNNSVYVVKSAFEESVPNQFQANASIWLKDAASTAYDVVWHKIQAYDNDLYFSNSTVLTENNAADILANIYLYEPSNVSNIIITGGYINFFNEGNTNQGPGGVGLRYSNGRVQFNSNGSWYNIDSINTVSLNELADVDITNIQSNQYLRWNGSSNLWVNSNLTLLHDPNPTLGANLNFNSYDLIISDNSNVFIRDNDNNPVVQFTTQTGGVLTGSNYIDFNNSNIGSDPVINSKGTDTDVGLRIQTKGDGNLILDTSSGGNVYVNSSHLDIYGFIKSSIYRSSSNSGVYLPSSYFSVPLSSDTVIFNFDNSNSSGTYWANIASGIEGQKLNLIFYNSGSSTITLLVDFGNNNLGSGNGLATKLQMIRSGQGASLMYLGNPAIWQIINTGATIL